MKNFSAVILLFFMVMKVDQIVCEKCAAKLQKMLQPVCKTLKIDTSRHEATCGYETPVTAEQVLASANKTGFEIQQIH